MRNGPQSNRFRSTLAGANTNTIIERKYEDFSVPNFSFFTGATSFDDRIDGWFDKFFVDGDLQLHLAQQVDRELMAAIDLCLPFLAAEALAIDNGKAEY